MRTVRVLSGEQRPLAPGSYSVCVCGGVLGVSASSPHETKGETEAPGGKRIPPRSSPGRHQKRVARRKEAKGGEALKGSPHLQPGHPLAAAQDPSLDPGLLPDHLALTTHSVKHG